MKIFIFIFLICISCYTTLGQKTVEKVDITKALSDGYWFGTDSIPNLEGKTVIIDFWASWCDACLKSLPHLNSLAEEFGNSDVIFISLNSHDTKKTIEELISNNRFESFVVSESDKVLYNYLDVQLLPSCFIIGKSGNIIWEDHPGKLTNTILKGFIKHQESYVPKQNQNSYEFKFSNSNFRDKNYISYDPFNGYVLKINNHSLGSVVKNLFSLSQSLYDSIEIINPPINTYINFYSSMTDSSKTSKDFCWISLNMLSSYFNFHVDTVKTPVTVYKLKVIDTLKLNKYKIEYAWNDVTRDSTNMVFKGCLLFFSEKFTLVYKKRVFTDINCDMKYKISIDFSNSFEKIKNVLYELYGIELYEEQKLIKVSRAIFNN